MEIILIIIDLVENLLYSNVLFQRQSKMAVSLLGVALFDKIE